MGTFADVVTTLTKSGAQFIEATIRYATPADGKCSSVRATLDTKVETIARNANSVYEKKQDNSIYLAVGQIKDCIAASVRHSQCLNAAQLADGLHDTKIKLYRVDYKAHDQFTNPFTGETGSWEHDNIFYYVVDIAANEDLKINAKIAKILLLNPNADITNMI